MTTQITNKQVKIVSNVDFNEKEIENAVIDAEKNEITNLDIPTKVSDLENDSGYTTTADVNSEIIASSTSLNNNIDENSYQAATSHAIAKDIEEKKIAVVDNFVTELPVAEELGQNILNTIDNKIYKTETLKQINDILNVVGTLQINSNGEITGFSEDNYITYGPVQSWTGLAPIKLSFSIGDGNYSTNATIFSIIRNDDSSTLFGIDVINQGFGNRNTLKIYTKKRDGTIVNSAEIVVSSSESIVTIETTKSCYIKVIIDGAIKIIKYFDSLKSSTDIDDDFYYDIQGNIKISSVQISQGQQIQNIGIGTLYGLNSEITYQYQGPLSNIKIAYEEIDSFMWNKGILLNKNKILLNLSNKILYSYDGEKLIELSTDLTQYQKKLTAGDNITISGEGYVNFSDTNYLQFINNVSPVAVARDIWIKFNISELNRNNTLLYTTYDTNKYFSIQINNENKLNCVYINQNGVTRTETGTHTFQANKDYWVWITSQIYPQAVYFIEDNNYTIDTLPAEFNDWTFDIESSYFEYFFVVNQNSPLYIGYNVTDPTNYFAGAIKECRVRNINSQNILTLTTAVEGTDFINNGCLKGPAISAIVSEIDSALSTTSENAVQNKVITTTLNNKQGKAETITIDTASVEITEIKANTNYKLSNSNITSITFSDCEQSELVTKIDFTTGTTAPVFTDNSGIDWADGETPVFQSYQHYWIIISDKVGFVKEIY